MKYFIEVWKAKEAWKKLSQDEKNNYLNQLGPNLQKLAEQGVEIVNWSVNESKSKHGLAFDYFAIWKFPDQSMVEEFEKMVDEAGWYEYFEQKNLSGEADSPQNILQKMI